jgi:hypothetical protein
MQLQLNINDSKVNIFLEVFKIANNQTLYLQ